MFSYVGSILKTVLTSYLFFAIFADSDRIDFLFLNFFSDSSELLDSLPFLFLCFFFFGFFTYSELLLLDFARFFFDYDFFLSLFLDLTEIEGTGLSISSLELDESSFFIFLMDYCCETGLIDLF